MLCEGFCVNWKATWGSTVKPVEGGRVKERDSWMRGTRWVWGFKVSEWTGGEVFGKREHTGGRRER